MRPFGKRSLSPLLPPLSLPLHHHRSIPLGLVTASVHGRAPINIAAILETREAEFKLDTTKPFKVNADTNGVCASFRFADRDSVLIFVPRSRVVHTLPPRRYHK